MGDLSNKIAIVTGGAHGIGKAIAEVFAEQGAQILIADLDATAGEQTVSHIQSTGGRAKFMQTDVADYDQVVRAVEAAGQVDVLVNNAAYVAIWNDVVHASQEEWDKCYRVALMGTAHFIKRVVPIMIPRQSGSIINISSVQGIVAAHTSAAYTSIKHALVGLTRNVAYDYGPHNIRCNAICPGPIQVRYSPEPGTELHQRQVSKTFLGRIGKTREVAHTAAFLASDKASYITGAVIPVDGGWSCM